MGRGAALLLAAGRQTYRFLRFTITQTSTNDYAGMYELDYSADGGSTWLPSSTMTSNSAPSPLVASASQEFSAPTYSAFVAFDNNNSTRWTSSGTGMPQHITIDFGSGNGISPNRIRWRTFNAGSPNASVIAGNVKGSNTGSFAGEEVTLLTFSGLSSQTDGTDVTLTI